MSDHWDVFQELHYPWLTLEQWLKDDMLNFDAKVRLQGPTVLDTQLSYCIYKSAHETTPYIVHNLYELIAFMAHPRFALTLIAVDYRAHPKPQGFKMIPLPWSEVYLAEIHTNRVGERKPLIIVVNGAPYHTGVEGRSWW